MFKGCAYQALVAMSPLTALPGAESPVPIRFRHFQRNFADRILPCVSTSITTLIAELNCDDLPQPSRLAATNAGNHSHRPDCGTVRLCALSPCTTLVSEI